MVRLIIRFAGTVNGKAYSLRASPGCHTERNSGVDNHLVVDMATLPILEQMKLARSAGTLIGQHGAALSHGMWMHPNSTLVEVDVQKQCSCYHNIARWNRLRYELRHLSN